MDDSHGTKFNLLNRWIKYVSININKYESSKFESIELKSFFSFLHNDPWRGFKKNKNIGWW